VVIGSTLGSFQVLEKLGEGGMGEVYRAHDTRLNRQVAIKVLPDAFAADPERVARFHREAQAVAALNHTGIAAIYDFADADGTKFLVLELIEGDTLAERVARNPIPVEESLTLSVQLLEALEFAHAKGICHRDLKPANIKLTPDGAVKVLDFGLAKMLAPTSAAATTDRGGAGLSPAYSLTMSLPVSMQGMILGTAGYMSPEQAKGFDVDQRSDLFAFGCILYEMLTGRRAFEGETASEILASVIKSDVDFSPLPPRLHPRFIELLQRCLEKNPKKRYHAAADVRVEIETLMARRLIREEPQATVAPTRPLWRRAIVPLASALLAAAAAGYGGWALKPDPARTVGRFIVELPDGQSFSNTSRRFLDVSPDGRRLAYLANNRLQVREFTALEAHAVVVGEGVAILSSPAFSPDGASIAYFMSDAAGTQRLMRVSVSGGAPVLVAELKSPPNSGLRWTDNGFLAGLGASGIVRVPPEGGSPTVVAAAGSDEMLGSPELLPGGRAILYAVKKSAEVWEQAQVVVQRLDGGERKVLVNSGTSARYVETGHLLYMLRGVLLAQRFDLSQLTTVGGPVPVVEGVRRAVSATTAGSAQMGVSRTGTLVFVPGVVGGGETQAGDLAYFDRKGSNQPFNLPSKGYRAPRVSRDGKFVTFESVDDKESVVWIYDLSRTRAIQRLTFEGRNKAPMWSPDGKWIAFQSDREGDLAIYRQPADGSGAAERLTKPASGVEHIPMDWSNGAHILLTVLANQTFSLATMAMSDRKISPVRGVESPALINAMFSPDGRWIVYQGSASSSRSPLLTGPAVFVEPFPGTRAKYMLPITGGHPTWSPKGDEILVNSAPQQSTIVSVTTSPAFSFGQPTDFPRATRLEPNPAATPRNVDFMPDGERLVGVLVPGAAGGANSNEIVVVMNWFDELRQRVPR
jgi:serine/threonine-protein kinase